MGYLTVNSIDELNNYIHSYGPDIPAEYKHVIANDKVIVYDKNDVLNNYRCAYYPYTNEYIVCKTKEDYIAQCNRFYERYKLISADVVNNVDELRYWNIPGSIMKECLDPENHTDIYESIKSYDRNMDPTKEQDTNTKDIRVFPGKAGSFSNEVTLKFIAAGFNEISNDRGVSYQLKGCSNDEIDYWTKILKQFGFYYKINDSKFSRAENYRDTFFLNTKPVTTEYYLCGYCKKIRPKSWMVNIEQNSLYKLENRLSYRRDFKENTLDWLSDGNKIYACKKCAALKGDATFPWDHINTWNQRDGLFCTLRRLWRIYGRILIGLIIVVALINY